MMTYPYHNVNAKKREEFNSGLQNFLLITVQYRYQDKLDLRLSESLFFSVQSSLSTSPAPSFISLTRRQSSTSASASDTTPASAAATTTAATWPSSSSKIDIANFMQRATFVRSVTRTQHHSIGRSDRGASRSARTLKFARGKDMF